MHEYAWVFILLYFALIVTTAVVAARHESTRDRQEKEVLKRIRKEHKGEK